MINIEGLNNIDNIYKNNDSSTIEIKSLPAFENDIYDFNDSKSFDHYIADLERIVRRSFEYRQLISYLRNIEGMSECSFLENVESRADSKVKIEIHHSPFTLYDICVTVFRKRSALKESLNINDVAEEVMYLHYLGYVGLIPLSATVHDMVHSAYLFIPTNKIRGNYRAFMESYYNYINPELLDCVDSLERATEEELYKERMKVFNNHRLYVDIDGSIKLPHKESVRSDIKNRISEIKGDNGKKNRSMCVIIDK